MADGITTRRHSRLSTVLALASILLGVGFFAAGCSGTSDLEGSVPSEQDSDSTEDLFEGTPECNYVDNPEDCEGWRCYEDERGRVCERTNPDRPDGRPGWICDDDSQPGYTTCVREDDAGGGSGRWRCRDGADGSIVCTSDDPGGEGGWECVYTDEGVDCTRTDHPGGGGGDWDCTDDDTGTHCTSDDPANANDDPGGGGWDCRTDGDTRICDDDHDDDEPGNSRDNPDGGPGWDCFNDVNGRHCRRDNSDGGPGGRGSNGRHDTPDGGSEWDCHTVEGERVCSSDDPDGGGPGWDCYYDVDRNRTVCTDEPDTPTDDPGWDCYETENQRICVDDEPDDPDGPEFTDCGDPAGNINGRVCAPSGDFWIVGATVSVSWTDCLGQTQTVQTQTDAEGYFVLTGVKEGEHTVSVSKGPFEAQYSVTVAAGETFTIPLGDFCFDQTTNIAVVTGQFDQVEAVLDDLGFTYDLFAGYPNSDEARALLGDLGRMNDYDVIFLNCGTSFRGIMDDRVVLEAIKANIREYVSLGGRLYVSDWDWLYIEEPFPDKVDFYGEDDTSMFDVLQGATGLRQATVVDPELLAVLGESRVTLNFDYPDWAIVQSVSDDVRVFLRGNVQTIRGGLVNDVPLLMSFKHGEGSVLFTSTHIHKNQQINTINTFTIFGFE